MSRIDDTLPFHPVRIAVLTVSDHLLTGEALPSADAAPFVRPVLTLSAGADPVVSATRATFTVAPGTPAPETRSGLKTRSPSAGCITSGGGSSSKTDTSAASDSPAEVL